MKIKHIVIFLGLLLSGKLHAQDTLLIGKWQLIEMQKDSIIIFDRDNVDITVKEGIQSGQIMDSSNIQNYKKVIHPLMKQLYYSFSENRNLTAGVLDLNEGEYVFAEKTGGYGIDSERLNISISGSIDSYIFSIENDTLILIPIINREIYRKGYAKYERVE